MIEELTEFIDIYDGYEYDFIPTKATWAVHEVTAVTSDYHFASIHSLDENKFLARQVGEQAFVGT